MKIERYFSGYKDGYIILIVNLSTGTRFLMGSGGDFETARLGAIDRMHQLRWSDCRIAYWQQNVSFVEEFYDFESCCFTQCQSEPVRIAMLQCILTSSSAHLVNDTTV